jgi:hypothetical protein
MGGALAAARDHLALLELELRRVHTLVRATRRLAKP